MIAGRSFWTWVWAIILGLGSIGFIPAIQWGRGTHWKNIDEILRAVGTIFVALGMLVLLQTQYNPFGYSLLILALLCFVLAFLAGKRAEERSRDDH